MQCRPNLLRHGRKIIPDQVKGCVSHKGRFKNPPLINRVERLHFCGRARWHRRCRTKPPEKSPVTIPSGRPLHGWIFFNGTHKMYEPPLVPIIPFPARNSQPVRSNLFRALHLPLPGNSSSLPRALPVTTPATPPSTAPPVLQFPAHSCNNNANWC